MFKKAERIATIPRVAFTGPTNSGKTLSALMFAYGIVEQNLIAKNGKKPKPEDVWDKIALIDTERDRALMYADRDDLPFNIGKFLHASITPPYTPAKAIKAAVLASKTIGPDGVAIVDSLTHFWAYEGGVLDINHEMAKKNRGNSYISWKEAGKLQNELIDVLLSLECATIVTMRSKMDYVLEQNAQGKSAPKKVGLKPMQRDDVEYEFDTVFMLDTNHQPSIVKDTTIFGNIGKILEPINTKDGNELVKFLKEGIPLSAILEARRSDKIEQMRVHAKNSTTKAKIIKLMLGDQQLSELTMDELKDIELKLEEV